MLPFLKEDNKLRIVEIYLALQGEVIHSGVPTIFIRAFDCALRCKRCDSKFCYATPNNPAPEEGKDFKIMDFEDILREVKSYSPYRLCELTGGEPLLQPQSLDLIKLLVKEGYYVDIETSGDRDFPLLENTSVIFDVKCPSTNMQKTTILDLVENLREQDAVKFVVEDREDLEYARRVLEKYNIKASRWLSPSFGFMKPQIIAEYILQHKLIASLSLQIHKILYEPDARRT